MSKSAYDPLIHHRRSIRLSGYDYSRAGMYFITLVTYQRERLFGEVKNGQMVVNLTGECAASILMALPAHFHIAIDCWVIMPDHVHMVVEILENQDGDPENRPSGGLIQASYPPHGTKPESLGAIIQNFKSISSRRINSLRNTKGAPVWQRNYYEHIVRNESALNRIRQYILDNPKNWDL